MLAEIWKQKGPPTRKTHRKASQEQRLSRMGNHGPPDLRIQHIASNRDDQKDDEQGDVDTEEHVRDVL